MVRNNHETTKDRICKCKELLDINLGAIEGQQIICLDTLLFDNSTRI